jgi:hypothetical protein
VKFLLLSQNSNNVLIFYLFYDLTLIFVTISFIENNRNLIFIDLRGTVLWGWDSHCGDGERILSKWGMRNTLWWGMKNIIRSIIAPLTSIVLV